MSSGPKRHELHTDPVSPEDMALGLGRLGLQGVFSTLEQGSGSIEPSVEMVTRGIAVGVLDSQAFVERLTTRDRVTGPTQTRGYIMGEAYGPALLALSVLKGRELSDRAAPLHTTLRLQHSLAFNLGDATRAVSLSDTRLRAVESAPSLKDPESSITFMNVRVLAERLMDLADAAGGRGRYPNDSMENTTRVQRAFAARVQTQRLTVEEIEGLPAVLNRYDLWPEVVEGSAVATAHALVNADATLAGSELFRSVAHAFRQEGLPIPTALRYLYAEHKKVVSQFVHAGEVSPRMATHYLDDVISFMGTSDLQTQRVFQTDTALSNLKGFAANMFSWAFMDGPSSMVRRLDASGADATLLWYNNFVAHKMKGSLGEEATPPSIVETPTVTVATFEPSSGVMDALDSITRPFTPSNKQLRRTPLFGVLNDLLRLRRPGKRSGSPVALIDSDAARDLVGLLHGLPDFVSGRDTESARSGFADLLAQEQELVAQLRDQRPSRRAESLTAEQLREHLGSSAAWIGQSGNYEALVDLLENHDRKAELSRYATALRLLFEPAVDSE